MTRATSQRRWPRGGMQDQRAWRHDRDPRFSGVGRRRRSPASSVRTSRLTAPLSVRHDRLAYVRRRLRRDRARPCCQVRTRHRPVQNGVQTAPHGVHLRYTQLQCSQRSSRLPKTRSIAGGRAVAEVQILSPRLGDALHHVDRVRSWLDTKEQAGALVYETASAGGSTRSVGR